jgi:hypothetical protein
MSAGDALRIENASTLSMERNGTELKGDCCRPQVCSNRCVRWSLALAQVRWWLDWMVAEGSKPGGGGLYTRGRAGGGREQRS